MAYTMLEYFLNLSVKTAAVITLMCKTCVVIVKLYYIFELLPIFYHVGNGNGTSLSFSHD